MKESEDGMTLPRLEIGVDCIEVARFSGTLSDKRLTAKLFTQKEIAYCSSFESPALHLAARFAAKEAVTKALAPLGVELRPNEIEVINETDGHPKVHLRRDGLEWIEVKVSITHSDKIAVAFAVAMDRG